MRNMPTVDRIGIAILLVAALINLLAWNPLIAFLLAVLAFTRFNAHLAWAENARLRAQLTPNHPSHWGDHD
ncbi:hypothetical protein ABH922_003045 [Rhodococcus sp. 27YEA15]|uniref:hypothetical protein n=1 Tax=Rhodococcus sp. 27YEA15 TaxID=3156259 RepID=UPI003C7B9E69